MEMFLNYFKMPSIFILNTLPVIGIMSLGFFLTNSVGTSYLISSIIILGGSFINFYKIQFRNDPFMYEDLQLIKEASKMLGNFKIVPNILLISIIIVSVILIVLIFRWTDIKANRNVRLIGGMAAMGFLFLTIKVYPNQTLYQYTESNKLRDSGNQLEQFSSRGFVYPFFYSTRYNHVEKPSGYDKEYAKGIWIR